MSPSSAACLVAAGPVSGSLLRSLVIYYTAHYTAFCFRWGAAGPACWTPSRRYLLFHQLPVGTCLWPLLRLITDRRVAPDSSAKPSSCRFHLILHPPAPPAFPLPFFSFQRRPLRHRLWHQVDWGPGTRRSLSLWISPPVLQYTREAQQLTVGTHANQRKQYFHRRRCCCPLLEEKSGEARQRKNGYEAIQNDLIAVRSLCEHALARAASTAPTLRRCSSGCPWYPTDQSP